MHKKITISLFDPNSISNAIKEIENYQKWVERKKKELMERLAKIGVERATLNFSQAIYDGVNDVQVYSVNNGNEWRIIADGTAVAFIEFGAGARYGDGHPLNGEFGTGPGTYPEGKGHWNDPEGWFFFNGAGYTHTYGNPPNMAMYDTYKYLQENLTNIAREVFNSD